MTNIIFNLSSISMRMRQQGSALILALWVTSLLGLLMLGVISTVRLQNVLSHEELQRTKALIAAEAGIAIAVKMLLTEPSAIIADGRVYLFEFDKINLSVRLRSEHGKLDVNLSSLENFSKLLRSNHATSYQIEQLAQELRKRRNSAEPVKDLEELLEATSMTTDLYQRILPFVTLWSGRGMPDARFADEPLRLALNLKSVSRSMGNPGSAMSIEVQAELPDSYKAQISTTVLLGSTGTDDSLYRTVQWQER
ncbi:type II secretion system protein GspK [Pseudomonas syringae]|uniref:type II secretion system protein GspK n=1 Tax=Pseudomonas syringae TaxID=317 RepID=UPI000E31885F|nr:type II secretion system protein GspK [Pseudomonas syringae]